MQTVLISQGIKGKVENGIFRSEMKILNYKCELCWSKEFLIPSR